jgi:pilus assembly protein CpaF
MQGESSTGRIRGRYRVSKARPSFYQQLVYFGLERAWNTAMEEAGE